MSDNEYTRAEVMIIIEIDTELLINDIEQKPTKIKRNPRYVIIIYYVIDGSVYYSQPLQSTFLFP